MCGIAGIIGRPDPEAVRRMVTAMHHRGPDDRGQYADDHASLGMTRLAILDLSSAGHQPMNSPDDRFWIVYNGEVYNFQEKRKHLESMGHVFRSRTDTEVVLHLYQQYGMDCVNHLRGMFAFAVWDRQERVLFAARDHLGIKPLLYVIDHNGGFLFASELKALLASLLVDRELDPQALAQYLSQGYILPPHTMVRDIRALGPGQYLRYSHGQLRIQTYWDLGQTSSREVPDQDYESAKEQTRSMVISAVREQLVTDVPLGVFLSGGLDSAVIVAAMVNAGAQTIETFSIGFDEAGVEIDEREAAAETANHFGVTYNQISVTGRDVAAQFDEFVQGLDQPSLDGLNSFLVAKHARQGVTVALSGIGGDELFTGYSWGRAIATEQGSPRAWRTTLAGNMLPYTNKLLPENLRWRVSIAADRKSIPTRYALSTGNIFSPPTLKRVLEPSLTEALQSNVLTGGYEAYDDPLLDDPIQRVTRLDLKTYMAGRLLRDVDAVGMANSLEVRFPLIDHRLVDYAFSLPSSFKVGAVNRANASGHPERPTYGSHGVKRLLFDSFATDLPAAISERSKSGFGLPFARWLRTDLSPLVETVLMGRGPAPCFQRKSLRRLWSDWQAGRAVWRQVWLILVFDAWYRGVFLKSAGREC